MSSKKVWHFLLPDSGEHRLEANGLATILQKTPSFLLDGAPVSGINGPGTLSFSGPGGALLELRREKQKDKSEIHALFVNGHRCEEYIEGAHHDGIRDLRHMKEGSYTISPCFDACSLELNVVRRFRFKAADEVHEVAIAHLENVWQVVLDSKMIDRLAHTWRDNSGSASFEVPWKFGKPLLAKIDMKWDLANFVWNYKFTVNGEQVPHCWVKGRGELPNVIFPVVAQAPADAANAQPVVEVQPVVAVPEPAAPPPPPQTLPQGVSFDAASGNYQANIRSSAGRFVFLGEFKTPEEAHARYVESIPIHCPEKKVVPTVG